MLATRTIEALRERHPQRSGIPSYNSVSFLYCKDDNPNLQNCAQIMKVAALQLSNANAQFSKHIATAIGRRDDTLFPARQLWQRLFLDFFSQSADVSATSSSSVADLVVDGLDETPKNERAKFFDCCTALLRLYQDSFRCNMRVIMFSRPDIRHNQNDNLQICDKIIEVNYETNKKNLDEYIKQSLKDVIVLKQLKKMKRNDQYRKLAKEIYDDVAKRSLGMFLWTRLVFD